MKLVDPMLYVKLKASGRLPSPKGLVLAIIRLLQRENYRIDDLVRLVKSDPAIAGELLKFSNIATLGLSRPIASLSQAVTILGTNQLRAIVISFSVLNNNRHGICPQFDYEKFWSRALATAISAQALAAYAKINAEENFTAGLLCSLGELALASIFPERYGEIISTSDNDSHNRLSLERTAFGSDHRELNATLLLEWGLPLELVTAIYHCENVEQADLPEESRLHWLTLSLNVALTLADICVADEENRKTMLPNLHAKAARFGITINDMNSMADNIIASWKEWGKFLKIQTQEIKLIGDWVVENTHS